MKQIVIILLSVVFVGCISQKQTTQTIVSCSYNGKKNQTEYMVFPYGSVNIPGKWERTVYNRTARQQFFLNSDSITITISLGQSNKFEFNADGSKKGYEFVKTFFNWESGYFAKTFNLAAQEIESSEDNNYLIWRLYGNYNNSEYDTYFLSAERNGIFKNFAVMGTDKWTLEQKIDFLKQLYLQQ